MLWPKSLPVPTTFLTQLNNVNLYLRREDLLHPLISGNKFRKLKYNFEAYDASCYKGVLTFGGAYSNHLVATAAAGNLLGVPTFGLVRGEELAHKSLNPSLRFCKTQGMELYFIDRITYRKKEKAPLVAKLVKENSLYLLPEGGTNSLAIKGCCEILQTEDQQYDTLCVSVGTAGTFSGLAQSKSAHQSLLGFQAVNDPNLQQELHHKLHAFQNCYLNKAFLMGGYAKATNELVHFINNFAQTHQILLDPIYTGKMLFGIFALIKENKWSWGNNVLIIHTGGLQAIEGFNLRQKQKGRPCIDMALYS